MKSTIVDRELTLLLMALLVHIHALSGASYKPILPLPVKTCVERKEVASTATIERSTNPYYLRADFDGDGQPDYAVSVKGRKSKRAGVAICHASGYVAVLRGDTVNYPPFSDMPDDNFLSGDWYVVSKSEALQRVSKTPTVHRPVGEAILMPWGDATGLLYYDGKHYRWTTLDSVDR